MAEQKPQPKRAPRKAAEDHAPWLPAKWEPADATAIQALYRGDADSEQQRRALRWITEAACGLYEFAYHPGSEDGRRETDFALGRQYVGHQIRKLNGLAVSALLRRVSENG